MSENDAGLGDIAAELYALPPTSFTAERNARAAAASGSLARAIAKLRKPTVAAWAVNLLVRDGQLGDAVELSRALHEAQDDLDAAELARLGKQRRALVAALARRAGELAAAAGTPLSPAMTEAVEHTVNAAVVDEAAGAAVLTGRLVTAIDLAAVSDGTLAAAVAGAPPEPVAPAPARDDLAARRARKAAERAVREAERARAEADRTVTATQGRLDTARERADRVHERIAALRDELERVERDAAAADAEVERREGERADAADAARRAATALERAEAARDDRGADS